MEPILSIGPFGAWAALLLQAASAEAPPDSVDPPAPPEQGEPIFVTGSRIQAPNRQSASPIETVRREDFTLTGVPNVEQTLNQLPQLRPSFTNTSNNPGSGAATLDLRGLGTVRTLILVNGRRWIANDAAAVPEIDVNTIPAALIDRVDIVTGGASAVYGSDAVTGVINFVLKKRLDGLHLEANNNLTEMGDGRSSSIDLSYGTSFLGGRGNVVASVGWLDQAPILQRDRDFTSATLANACIFKDSRDSMGVGMPSVGTDCGGANEEWGLIRSGSGIIPEGRITQAVLFPTGNGLELAMARSRFAPDGSIVPYISETDSYNIAPDNYLQVPLQRVSAHLLGSIEISPAVEPYVELSFIRTRSPQQLAPAPATIGTGADSVAAVRINLDNPFLPDQARQILDIRFGRDASGGRGFLGSSATGFTINPAYLGDADGIISLTTGFFSRLTGLGPRRAENERKAYRGLLGVRGQLSPRWSYDVYYSHSDVAHDVQYLNSASALRMQQAMLARLDSSGQIACIDPSNGCVPINLFGQQGISDAAAEFLRIDAFETTRVKEQIAEATAKADLVELPAGTLKTVLGVNWRKTDYDFRPDRSFEEGDALGFSITTAAAGKTRVLELFGEAMVPILDKHKFAEELSAELGLRFSDYSSVGGVWTWKAQVNWAPVRRLRFRAGAQKAVRAPNVRELFEESTANFDIIGDPCVIGTGFTITPELIAACARNGASELLPDNGETLVHTSGSANLKAETAKTITIGAAFQPMPGLEATIDYYNIDIRNVIDVFGGGAGLTVAGCVLGAGGDPADPLCQAVVRDPDGLVSDVFTPTANLARLKARGIDWQLSARFPLASGQAAIGLSGTRLLGMDRQANPNLAFVRNAGSFGFPRWKLFNRLTWSRRPVTFSLRHRFFSSTEDRAFALTEALGIAPPNNVPVHANRMQARHYFDAAATFDLASRFKLTLGVNNLTDAKPSLVGSSQVQANTDPSLYDVLGRRFFVSIAARIR